MFLALKTDSIIVSHIYQMLKSTHITEEHIAAIFRIEEAEQYTRVQAGGKPGLSCWYFARLIRT
jgi:hypothetical protein